MLRADKSRWFEELFALYCRNLFKRRFSALKIAGIERLEKRDKNLPLLLYANHSSWWDGLVAFEVGRRAKLDHFVMMEEKQLKSLFLFRRLGAFSVVRESPREAVKSVNYAVDLLREKPNRALWIFPQGEILPNDTRPLGFYNGAARILGKLEKCLAAPVAMRYEFLDDFKPEALARVGELELVQSVNNSKKLSESLSQKLTTELDNLKQDILQGNFNNYGSY